MSDKIVPINIEDEMKSAYIDYSMSVIVSRALPDVRDGLKPVHRRVLYGMNELGLTASKAHKKSARIVGEVLGKYHPHGDTSVYDSMVRMAQDWSLRYPLVDGQGNYGSMDGDSPAAMRYTEARLQKISDEILSDINKETVDFTLNFDDTLEEPSVLPTKVPNLLINGASGIAVGMATNMLPHNLSEVVDGTIAAIDDPEISIDGLMEHIKAPDFPTGGTIYGLGGVKEAFETGRGRVVVRGKANIETIGNKETIIITEIPYQVNKANLVMKIADLVNEEKITGISDVRDESDRNGLRIVVEVKRDAMANVILSKLFKYTPLQSSFGVNNVCLVNGRPMLLNLKQIIEEFIKFRLEVVVRRTNYDLKKAEERAHILEGLIIAIDNLDEVIKIIRGSATVEDAKNSLMSTFDLSELQAKAILEMRLQKLVSLEMDKLRNEYDELIVKINDLKDILESESRQREIIKEELREIKEKYGDERRTDITFADGEISIEDMIPNDEVVISISNLGYVKRTKSSEFKAQGRGGTGSRGSKTKNEDFVEHLFVGNNHNYLLLFTEQGRCFWIRVYEIPEGSKTGTGRVIQNFATIPKDDKVKAYILIKDLEDEEFLETHNIIFATKKGQIKKTSVRAYSRPRTNGINAITIKEDDQLLEVKLTDGNQEIFLANRSGKAIRFKETDVREMGRTASGVRGMNIADDDEIIGMVTYDEGTDADTTLLTLSEKGLGKRSRFSEYRSIKRGGKGVTNLKVTEKTGNVAAIKKVSPEDDVMISSKGGIMIRVETDAISLLGRSTQGVKVINLKGKDQLSDITVIERSEEDENLEENAEMEGSDNGVTDERNTDIVEDEMSEDVSQEDNNEESGDETSSNDDVQKEEGED